MEGTADPGAAGVTFDAVRAMAAVLPGAEEGTSYGTPAFRVRGRFFVRLREDGETLVVKTDFYERDHLIASQPDGFYTTDHYRDHPSVLVRLPAVRSEPLRALLTESWRRVAPRRLVEQHDAAS